MIFHLPFKLLVDVPSGSVIRPLRMLQAFKNLGYEVDLIMGPGRERKVQIQKIKEKIRNGVKYDFLYSECSNLPTLLTEDSRVPLYPFLDFGFFRFCRTKKIRIGLFYRDVYWKFDSFKKNVLFMKRVLSLPFYVYDLYKYRQLLDILFLPSSLMVRYIDYQGRIEVLPPGIDASHEVLDNSGKAGVMPEGKINIFYVGGLKDIYNNEKLFEVVSRNDDLALTFCCREEEWLQERSKYIKYLNPRIHIIHKSSEELAPFYWAAHICSLFLKPIEYRTFAMPVKLFEYLGYGKPVVTTKGTAAGEFVEKYDIGWNIDYSVDSLESLLKCITGNKDILDQKRKNIERILPDHTWQARAEKVARDLTALT